MKLNKINDNISGKLNFYGQDDDGELCQRFSLPYVLYRLFRLPPTAPTRYPTPPSQPVFCRATSDYAVQPAIDRFNADGLNSFGAVEGSA